MKKGKKEKVIKENSKIPVLIKEVKNKFNRSQDIKITYHRELEIHFIKRGKGFYFIHNRKYSFDTDTAIIIYPDQQHFSHLDYPYFIEKISVYFSPDFLKKINFDISSIPHSVKLSGREKAEIHLIIDVIRSEIADENKFSEEIIEKAISIILILLKKCKYNSRVSDKRRSSVVDDIIDYINGNYQKNITISDLSKVIHKSESYLSHLFKDFTGIGIKSYLLQKRILEAKKILESQTDMKVIKVGEKVGFTSFALFNRTFKKITGITPSSYRNLFIKKSRK